MLKEPLYAEYQKKCTAYNDKCKSIDELQQSIKGIQAEKDRNIQKLTVERAFDLKHISQEKEQLENLAVAAKKGGVDGSAIKEDEISSIIQRRIDEAKEELSSYKQSKKNAIRNLEQEKKKTLDSLNAERDRCQQELNGLMNGGNRSGSVKIVNEGMLRQQLEREKEQKVADLSLSYDTRITETQNSLQKIDSDFAAVLSRELSYVENDADLNTLLSNLNAKAAANELLQVITDELARPVTEVIQRGHIDGGMRVVQLAQAALPLDDLSQYIPPWMITLVNAGLPLIGGLGFLAFFVFSGLRLGFVATASSAVASFLIWLAGAGLLGGIAYGIVEAKWGRGIIGGVIGGILGFLIASRWSITLPYEVTNVVEWIIKILICLLVACIVRALIDFTSLGKVVFPRLMIKVGPVKKAALLQQGRTIEERGECYYVLIKYKEIIEQVVNENKKGQKSYLESELEELKNEKLRATAKLAEELDKENNSKVAREKASAEESRRMYERQQKDLIERQDYCIRQLAEYNEEIKSRADSYDKNINDETQNYDRRIEDTKARLKELESELTVEKKAFLTSLEKRIAGCDEDYRNEMERSNQKIADCKQEYENRVKEVEGRIAARKTELNRDLKELDDIFNKLVNTTVTFEESKGVLSDYLYLYDEKSDKEPKELIAIKHDKKPIVFLYDINDRTNIQGSLFKFMTAVMGGFYYTDAREIFELSITDPVTQARESQQYANQGLLKIENDIRKLSASIMESMNKVAGKGNGLSIDDYNQKMYDENREQYEFLKYKIAEFIVPEEDAVQNTDFLENNLWGALGDGKKFGFLPIFFVSYSDWKDTLDNSSKLNSRFIMTLRRAIGSSNGSVYKINEKDITIKKL